MLRKFVIRTLAIVIVVSFTIFVSRIQADPPGPWPGLFGLRSPDCSGQCVDYFGPPQQTCLNTHTCSCPPLLFEGELHRTARGNQMYVKVQPSAGNTGCKECSYTPASGCKFNIGYTCLGEDGTGCETHDSQFIESCEVVLWGGTPPAPPPPQSFPINGNKRAYLMWFVAQSIEDEHQWVVTLENQTTVTTRCATTCVHVSLNASLLSYIQDQ